MKMMNVRTKITDLLKGRPGKNFSISEIADAIGSNNKATTAALGKLLKSGDIERPAKGRYAVKAGRPAPAAKEKVVKPQEPLVYGLSIVTVDLLVEGEQPEIDAGLILRKILENPTIHDAKVKSVAPADPTKLKIKMTLQD